MNAGEKSFEGGVELLGSYPEDPIGFLGPGQLILDQVQLPATDVGELLRLA